MSGPPPELIVFDCDGVLVDSEAIYIESELAHLAGLGARFERVEYMGMFMGLAPATWEETIAIEVERMTGSPLPEDFFKTLYEGERQMMEESLAPLPGALDVVSSLSMPVCVASSSRMIWLTWKLERTGLFGLFDPHIFSAELVPRGKPEPDLFLHAAYAMGASPARTVVVEDSANGVLAAKAAGMKVIGFTGGGHCLPGHGEVLESLGARAVVEHFAELPEVLG